MGSSGVYDVLGRMCYIIAVTLLKQHSHLAFKGVSIMTGIVTTACCLHENDLHATSLERPQFHLCSVGQEEVVTVANVHKVLTESQCTRAAECLLSAAQSVAEQEQGRHSGPWGQG